MEIMPVNQDEVLKEMGIEKDEDGKLKVTNVGDRLAAFDALLHKNIVGMINKIMKGYYKKMKTLDAKLQLPLENLMIEMGARIARIVSIGGLSNGFKGPGQARTRIDNALISNFAHGLLCEMKIAGIEIDGLISSVNRALSGMANTSLHDLQQQFKVEKNEYYERTSKK